MNKLIESLNLALQDVDVHMIRSYCRKVRNFISAYKEPGMTLKEIDEAVEKYKSHRCVYDRTMNHLIDRAGGPLTEKEQQDVEAQRRRKEIQQQREEWVKKSLEQFDRMIGSKRRKQFDEASVAMNERAEKARLEIRSVKVAGMQQREQACITRNLHSYIA